MCACVILISGSAGSAWETPFALYAPKKDGQPDAASAAYVLALQLPLEKVLRGGGIEFILKRDRKPEWVSNASGKNFFISLAKVGSLRWTLSMWLGQVLLGKRLLSAWTRTGIDMSSGWRG